MEIDKGCGVVLMATSTAKKPSLTLNLGTNGLKVTSELPPTARQAGSLQGLDLRDLD
ncbi:hypothetical protein J6590_027798 [Homalodisca vitripennis]|nr:hypothetical protein J6590_027798 [Homalodisca vitripennis]